MLVAMTNTGKGRRQAHDIRGKLINLPYGVTVEVDMEEVEARIIKRRGVVLVDFLGANTPESPVHDKSALKSSPESLTSTPPSVAKKFSEQRLPEQTLDVEIPDDWRKLHYFRLVKLCADLGVAVTSKTEAVHAIESELIRRGR